MVILFVIPLVYFYNRKKENSRWRSLGYATLLGWASEFGFWVTLGILLS